MLGGLGDTVGLLYGLVGCLKDLCVSDALHTPQTARGQVPLPFLELGWNGGADIAMLSPIKIAAE